MNAIPDNEQVLSRFGQWLDETRADADAVDESMLGDDEPAPEVGLLSLIEQLTALKHEVKLLTKAARATDERNEATLLSMQAAIEQFRGIEPREAEAAAKLARPLVEAIVDLDEAIVRGRRAILAARQRIVEQTNDELTTLRDRLEALYRAQPWWRRILCRPWHAAVKDVYSGRSVATQKQIFDSLVEGYGLIQERLQRTMKERSILRMECVGREVDPNAMTVLEAISDPARPPGLVVEEVRPGYYWKGKVLRFAEVKAVGQS